MAKTMNNFFANVRKIIAPGIVCILLFAVTSCDNSDELFSEETFTKDFFVRYDDCGWLLAANQQTFDRLRVFDPINLPREFQRDGLHVNVTYRWHTMNKIRCNYYRVVQIVAIEKAVSTSIFIVRKFDDCGWLLFEDLGDDNALVVAPSYLPKEFQQEGLRVQVTSYRYSPISVECEDIIAFPINIQHIMVVSEREKDAQTRITGGISVDIETTPWQVLMSAHLGGAMDTSMVWRSDYCT